jgi:ABC-type antimicrobial peptide transport system permease subunit
MKINDPAIKSSSLSFAQIFSWRLGLLMVICVTVLAAVAGWLPAFMAAEQDPAETLRQD